jgi:prevent-host-death family protein
VATASYTVATMDVSVREFKLHLGQYLARVRAGASLIVTARGKAVARVEPVQQMPEHPAAVQQLVDAGILVWRPPPRGFRSAVRLLPGDQTATDFVLEQRR